MRTILNLTFCLLVANTLFANPTIDTVSQQRAFTHAKQQINAMLTGNKQLSFEEAIYQLENAWYAGGIDYVSFKTNLDFHTQNIRALMGSINSPLPGASADVAIPRHLADKRNNNLLANYAIYTYLTQHSLWVHDSTITIQQPVQYSAEDPMGTTDWANSHITHLLNEGTGNCFAMAALFKIFADRLGTDAQLCTAPGHIYIRHADENGTEYNVELAGRKFPGTGSIEAITYTTLQAVKNGIAMRALNDTQAVALTMVYLAKARQYGMGLVDEFTADCAQTALNHDPNNLNAMLLKAETMEEELLATIAGEDIQTHPQFAAYQQWLQHIYSLGYRELPQDMKEKLVKGWGKESTGTEPVLSEDDDTRYASLSWGLFDEQVKNKQVEQYGRTLFNTATQTIAGFTTTSSAYNQYTYDPVVFAWEMDPMAHKMPGESPYSVLKNSPITFIDPNGDDAFFNQQGKLLWNADIGRNNNLIIVVDASDIEFYNALNTAKTKYHGDIYRMNMFMRAYGNKLTDLPVQENGEMTSHGKAVRKIAFYYKNSMGLKQDLNFGFNEDDPYAATYGPDYVTYFSIDDKGYVNSSLLNYVGNFKNLIVHEYDHPWGDDIGYSGNRNFYHLNQYKAQIVHPSWQETTDKWQDNHIRAINRFYNDYPANNNNDKQSFKNFFDSIFNGSNKSGGHYNWERRP